jgi:hypothetical protein
VPRLFVRGLLVAGRRTGPPAPVLSPRRHGGRLPGWAYARRGWSIPESAVARPQWTCRRPAGRQQPDASVAAGMSAGHFCTQLGLGSSPVIDRASRLAARWTKIW